MNADEFFQHLSEALYLLVFIVTAVQAFRRPLRARLDTALFFGVVAVIVVMNWVQAAFALSLPPIVTPITQTLLMAMPYLLLRLLDDFAGVRSWIMRLAEAGLLISALALFTVPPPLPPWLTLSLVGYFVAVQLYAGFAFLHAAGQSRGLTRRRMEAVATGSFFLGVLIFLAGVPALLPDLAPQWLLIVLQRSASVASGLAYFVGFAPPLWLRRAWQEPELRAFLRRTAGLPRLAEAPAVINELEQGTASALGAPFATVFLWDSTGQVFRFTFEGQQFDMPEGRGIVGRAFAEQRALFYEDVERNDPENAHLYLAGGARSVVAAPITAGDKRLGVLTVYGPRPPIFAEDDLTLLALLADQAAVVLESHALIRQAARLEAREEATRLKDDFLSAAAHDLRTPPTTLLLQAQFLEQQALRQPDAPADLAGIQRMVREARRMSALVTELLEAAQIDPRRLVDARESEDLVTLAREACMRHTSGRHPCRVEANGPVLAEVDRNRIIQLLDNLLENAVKYSPHGGEVQVRVWLEDEEARITVADRGIGIPTADMPHLFERFQRGANVDDRQFAGMGLGLYLCRVIAEQHGGRIWATSIPGEGSSFHVALPVKPALKLLGPNEEGVA